MDSTTKVSENQQSTSNSHLMSQSYPQQSYANITAMKIRPTKEEAIIMDAIEGLTNDDYIDGLEKLFDANNIRCIPKISGKRVVVYISKKEFV